MKHLSAIILRHLVAAIAILATTIQSSGYDFPNEKLEYKVLYKWGLIHKQAGTATVTLSKSGGDYRSHLTARTMPWADRIYRLRDTLTTVMDPSTLAPRSYVIATHEDGRYTKDSLKFSYNGGEVTAQCTRIRRGKKATSTTESHTTLSASGHTSDFLSAFYYLRTLPFDDLTPGYSTSINVFSGKRKEILTIKYSGLSKVKIDNKEFEAYKITFTFTSDGKKSTSDPVEAWISTDASHIPLKLVGKLKVGQVQCVLTSK